jgi:hypothetical protein
VILAARQRRVMLREMATAVPVSGVAPWIDLDIDEIACTADQPAGKAIAN